MQTDRINYIYVDYENIRDIDLGLIDGKPVKVMIATGKQQTTLPKDLVKQLLRFRDQVALVENEHIGKNALDFVLVYEIARQAITDPKGYFHVVSKDKGFDALVKYLHSQSIKAGRSEEFARIPILTDTKSVPVPQLADDYVVRMQKSPSNLPKRKQTLLSQINTHFGKKLDETTLESVVSELVKRKRVIVSTTGAVSYPASSSS